MLWLLLSALLPTAQADSFRLANGSTIEGTLATYELNGNCQIFVASGPVRGATLLLPCAEIHAFSRAGAVAPSMMVEEVVAPAAIVVPVQEAAPPQPVDAAPLAPAAPAAPAPVAPPPTDGPVSAWLPSGTVLPGDDGLSDATPATAQASNLRGTPRPAPSIEGGSAQEAPAAGASEPAHTDDGTAEPDAETPQGWRSKGDSSMPRWLQRAIYGDPPPAPESDEQGS